MRIASTSKSACAICRRQHWNIRAGSIACSLTRCKGWRTTNSYFSTSPKAAALSRSIARSRHRCEGQVMSKHHILILGGGFGGLYTALELEKVFKDDSDTEITLINRDNYFLFTPMLHEVAASDLDLTNIVSPIRKLLRKVRFFAGEVKRIDLANRVVTVAHGFDGHTHELAYDRQVIGVGTSTNLFNLPELE